MVLEAGYSDTATSWAPVIPALVARMHVVAYDRAGLGTSDPAPWLRTVNRRLADLAALIGHTTSGPCILVGHSWGGILVQGLPATIPSWWRASSWSTPRTWT